jgi:hypothetical protein
VSSATVLEVNAVVEHKAQHLFGLFFAYPYLGEAFVMPHVCTLATP